jgi:hypothetical protein
MVNHYRVRLFIEDADRIEISRLIADAGADHEFAVSTRYGLVWVVRCVESSDETNAALVAIVDLRLLVPGIEIDRLLHVNVEQITLDDYKAFTEGEL